MNYGYKQRPLLAASHDFGVTWTYPPEINVTLPTEINIGAFAGKPSCHGATCIAVGSYIADNQFYSLLVVTNDSGATWFTPRSGNTRSSLLSDSVCLDKTTCMAVGYRVLDDQPLLLQTFDAGVTWHNASLPAPFEHEDFAGISCSDTVCILSGKYENKNKSWPLLAVSQDKGTTWRYPSEINQAALVPYLTQGTLDGGSTCSRDVCVATGSYYDKTTERPLLVFSNDRGTTWSVPPELINEQSTFPIKGQFHDVSCDGMTCVAVGEYFVEEASYPLLAVTNDAGISWRYKKETSLVDLPTSFEGGALQGVHCHDEFCIASGSYESRELQDLITLPLLVISRDNGITWSYSSSVLSKEVLPYSFNGGAFYGIGQGASMLQNSSAQVIKPPKRLI